MNPFMNAMRYVGDLDDQFYDDERQRDVWNEASAVGFQLFYWISLVGAAILPWAGGRTGAWVSLSILVVATLISILTVSYAKAKGVDMYADVKLFRVRGLVTGVVMIVAFLGVAAKLAPDDYFVGDDVLGTWVGGFVGACVGGGFMGWLIARSRSKRKRFENEEFE